MSNHSRPPRGGHGPGGPMAVEKAKDVKGSIGCLLYTSPSPRDRG